MMLSLKNLHRDGIHCHIADIISIERLTVTLREDSCFYYCNCLLLFPELSIIISISFTVFPLDGS